MGNDSRKHTEGVERRKPGMAAAICLILATISMEAYGSDPTMDDRDRKIQNLEQMVKQLSKEVQALKQGRSQEKPSLYEQEQEKVLAELRQEIDQIKDSRALDINSWVNRFSFGGYGEMHANFGEGDTADVFDIHRLVLYLGYDFADWIQFHSETEIEHAFVSDDSGGELSMEQAYVDFLLVPEANIRVGRILTPMGIVNQKHEPPYFNGVERPSFAKYIIPTTWPSDGVGVFGSLHPELQYEVYVVGGLDGSEFSAKNGIRSGRIKERPSLHEPAFTGRVDWSPLINSEPTVEQELRFGFSTYLGGIDNGNQGKDPGIDGDIHMYSADFEYSISRFDFRGVIADIRIDGAREIGNGTAEEIFGFYVEGGYHFWCDSWKQGKLKHADAVVFVRYDDFDTQHDMPGGIKGNPVYDRNEWTLGINFYPVPQFVIKADYQIRDNASSEDVDNLLNLGVGWVF